MSRILAISLFVLLIAALAASIVHNRKDVSVIISALRTTDLSGGIDGLYYQIGKGYHKEGNTKEALKYLSYAADNGYKKPNFYLGYIHSTDAHDPQKAIDYFVRSLDEGE